MCPCASLCLIFLNGFCAPSQLGCTQQVATLQRDAAAARTDGAAAARGARLAAAARIADLETETARQREALRELSAAAESLAEENAALGGQLAGAQSGRRAAQADISHLEVGTSELPLELAVAAEESAHARLPVRWDRGKGKCSHSQHAQRRPLHMMSVLGTTLGWMSPGSVAVPPVQERLATLQELCLRGGGEPGDPTLALPAAATALGCVAAARERALAALATPELLAASAPPPGFDGARAPPPRDLVHALRELAALARERDGLAAQACAPHWRALGSRLASCPRFVNGRYQAWWALGSRLASCSRSINGGHSASEACTRAYRYRRVNGAESTSKAAALPPNPLH